MPLLNLGPKKHKVVPRFNSGELGDYYKPKFNLTQDNEKALGKAN